MTVGTRELRGRSPSIARRDTFTENANQEFYPRRLSRLRRSFSMDSSQRVSVFSVVSLDQVSDINALALPIYSSELYNGAKYTTVEIPQKTRVRPKSVMLMFAWTGTGGFGTRSQSPSPRSLVRRMTSLLSGSSRSPSPAEFVISEPFDPRHNTHIGVDPDTGKMTIIGEEASYRHPLTTIHANFHPDHRNPRGEESWMDDLTGSVLEYVCVCVCVCVCWGEGGHLVLFRIQPVSSMCVYCGILCFLIWMRSLRKKWHCLLPIAVVVLLAPSGILRHQRLERNPACFLIASPAKHL